MLVKLSKS